jgi:bacillolysin
MKQLQCFSRVLSLFVSLLAMNLASAQTNTTPTLLQTGNTFIQDRIESSDPQGWLFFKNSSDLKEGQLFSEQASAAGLSANDNMVLVKSEADEQGNTHNRYQQYYKNIEVEGGEIFEHVRDCYVYLLHGKIIEGLNFNAQPVITEAHALNNAKIFIGASQYAWENPDWEQDIKDDTGDPNATYYPTGSLILTSLPGTTLEAGNYRLTWKFGIITTDPGTNLTIYVNAISGVIEKHISEVRSNGPAVTLYDGTQTLDTKWFGGILHGHHHMVADDNGKRIETKRGPSTNSPPFNMFHPPLKSWNRTNDIFDLDDNWGADQSLNSSAHWAVSQSWDYFKNIHGRNGTDNSNRRIRI